jgi:FMN-dependent oxidoreductase (nitrilotriacetate monooxygenase family)
MANRRMRLVAGLQTGPTMQNQGMWRHPETVNGFLDPAFYEHVARTLEQGMFDALFFADTLTIADRYRGSHEPTMTHGGQFSLLDPVPVLAMMARVTRHIGLGLTMSTTFHHPFQLARVLGSLDVLSGGRVAWNVVTSAEASAAKNFGTEKLPARDARYDQADEVVEACLALWHGWDPDALIIDKQSGLFADPTKVRAANYVGQYVRSRGPLNVPRSPQGHPVLMQAGASPRGRAFAGRWAEMIFTLQYDKDEMRAFYQDVKGRMATHDRAPEDCAILSSIDLIIGETESIAREKQLFANSLVSVEQGLGLLSSHVGVDLSTFALDRPLSDLQQEEGSLGSLFVVMQGTAAEGLTLRQAALRYATSQLCPQLVGSPASIADQMQDLFESGGCDGFILNSTVMPGTFEQFVRAVVPELQRRGLMRTVYPHGTLRENLRSAT